MASRTFQFETFVDFPDDALSVAFPITARHVDALMKNLAAAGVTRVSWGYYADGRGGFRLPAGIGNDPSIDADQNQWSSYAATCAVLGNPLRVAADAAHRHGMELYAYYKPYETGPAAYFPEGSPRAGQWGLLDHLGGKLAWLDPFVVRNPHLRIKRRTDDLPPGRDDRAVRGIRLTQKDDVPTRITAENIEIWTSPNNYRYRRKPVDFTLADEVRPSEHEVRDVYGNLLTRRGDPVRILTLSGLDLADRYILVTTNFTDGPGDFENAWDRLVTMLDAEGREIPGVFATGTAIWFPEWEDPADEGVVFDTGRGPESIILDAPRNTPPPHTRSHIHDDVPGSMRKQGYVAFTRGRNAYLPGALCETEPEVQAFWLGCIQEMLDAGVDGVEFRVENHSSHTETPGDYGFNPAVMSKVDPAVPRLLANIARVRGEAYTDFLRKANALIHARGCRMRVNLNLDWFRDPSERPGSRRLAYPANIDFDWKTWLREGLADEAVLRPFAKPFASIFGGDDVAREMVQACADRGIPVIVNRYVYGNPGLAEEVRRVRDDGRFAGFILYETWSFSRAQADGSWRFSDETDRGLSGERPGILENRRQTACRVRKVLAEWTR